MRINTLIFIFILLADGGISQAQVMPGIEGGVGFATMHFEPMPPYTHINSASILSYHINGHFAVAMNSHWWLLAGIDFARKGNDRNFSYFFNDSFHESVHQKLAALYAQVPICLQRNISLHSSNSLFLCLGAAPGYLLAGVNHLDVTGSDSARAYGYHTTTAMRRNNPTASFDMSILLSAGYLSSGGWYLSASYSPGVNDIGLATEVDKNRMFTFNAGLYFNKKK